jgi:hypothetical protein
MVPAGSRSVWILLFDKMGDQLQREITTEKDGKCRGRDVYRIPAQRNDLSCRGIGSQAVEKHTADNEKPYQFHSAALSSRLKVQTRIGQMTLKY